MRKIGNVLLYSPSDLVTFVESDFVSWMDRLYLEFPDRVVPDVPEGIIVTIRAQGNQHEADYLSSLVAKGAAVTDLSENKNNLEPTLLAMQRGDPVIYQAYLSYEDFAGYADFLVRVPGDSHLGQWHYEVHDTKIAREPKPYHLIQLCCYAEMLKAIQGRRPKQVAVVLGNTNKEICRFRTDDFYFHYSKVKESFLSLQEGFDAAAPPPIRCKGDFGRWNSHVGRLLEEQDHLSRVANISVLQIARLQQDGITTMLALGETRMNRVTKMLPTTFERLRTQARLQISSKGKQPPDFELLPADENDPRRGLALLPTRNDGDIFFDLEGYPLIQNGLEYLFGVSYLDSGEFRYLDWWAHDYDAEKVAFAGFINWSHKRWKQYQGMHIYHYAAYEEAAVRRLLRRYPGICEQQVDDLLRNEVFVDLYTVVRQALIIGEPKYSLKNIEHLYRDGKRAGDVASADDSIVAYDNWLHDRDGETVVSSAKLRAIRDYNRDDCESTLKLAEWLRQLQAANALAYIPPSSGTDEKVRELTKSEVFAEELLAAIPTGADRESDPERWRTQELLANLLLFHRREDKPMWWTMYARHEMTEEQLAEDLNCLSGLKRTPKPPIPFKRSFLYEYGFDVDQDTKLDVGSKCILSHDLSCKATIELFDREYGLLSVKLGKDKPAPPLSVSLIPHEYVDASVITESILRTATIWKDSGTLPGAIWDFIRRERPRIASRVVGPIIPDGIELVTGTVEAVSNLQNSTLTIQGPPGTGKTYTAARAILAQLNAGRRVAVAANSHKAVNALLNEVAAAAATDKVLFQGIHVWRDPGELDQLPVGMEYRDSVKDIGSLSLINIVGGTAWCFSAPELEDQFTHLFVDEAGQVSIANLVGMARASKNVVLIGDQMQLNQPTQGCHPGECGLSCLEYLLQGHDTILPDFGVFLGVTRRMHPDVCSFISGICYEDRLQAFAATSNRTILPNGAKIVKVPSGLLFVPTEHDGNSQSSDEEVERVAEIVDELLNLSMYQDNGSVRRLSPDDILVVAPYNMQVRKLQVRLPCLRVGTVDKFQGQEAPIVIYSMCASSGEACPRGIDFLFSRNRTNVAISRAKSLAIIVASPSLIKTNCSSIGHMRLTNIVCRMVFEGVHSNG